MATSAFLAMWHGVKPEIDEDYNRWHTHEHILERVSVPGFLSGLRGVATEAPAGERYLTIYQSADAEVFDSPAYRQRLDNPTPWTQRIQPHITNMVRHTFLTEASAGAGIGPHITTVRISSTAPAARITAALLPDGLEGTGIASFYLGRQVMTPTNTGTAETALRGDESESAEPFTHVLVAYSVDAVSGHRYAASIAGQAQDGVMVVSVHESTLAQYLTHNEVTK